MSASSKLTSKELQELCVYGYIRENCIKLEMPEVLYKIFATFYVIPMDRWNNVFTEKMIIDEEQNAASLNEGSWHHAFGTDIVKKGMLNTWKFKVTGKPISVHSDQTLAILIGIMEYNKISSDLPPHFINEQHGGYGFYTYLADIKHNGWAGKKYGKRCIDGGIIKMTLDMTQKIKKAAILSYEINGTDYGIAWDDIDINKEYCMTVEMYHVFNQTIQIIE